MLAEGRERRSWPFAIYFPAYTMHHVVGWRQSDPQGDEMATFTIYLLRETVTTAGWKRQHAEALALLSAFREREPGSVERVYLDRLPTLVASCSCWAGHPSRANCLARATHRAGR